MPTLVTITINQVAEQLQISRRQVYNLVKKGVLKPVSKPKVSSRTYFYQRDIDSLCRKIDYTENIQVKKATEQMNDKFIADHMEKLKGNNQDQT